MFFTQEDFKKIEKWLKLNSKKDTDFKRAKLPLNGDELIAIIKNGENQIASLFNITSRLGDGLRYEILPIEDYKALEVKDARTMYLCTTILEDGEVKITSVYTGEMHVLDNYQDLMKDIILTNLKIAFTSSIDYIYKGYPHDATISLDITNTSNINPNIVENTILDGESAVSTISGLSGNTVVSNVDSTKTYSLLTHIADIYDTDITNTIAITEVSPIYYGMVNSEYSSFDLNELMKSAYLYSQDAPKNTLFGESIEFLINEESQRLVVITQEELSIIKEEGFRFPMKKEVLVDADGISWNCYISVNTYSNSTHKLTFE